MTDKTSLGDRMKQYEDVPRTYLMRHMPVIIRLDGRAFSGLCKRYFQEKPFDSKFQSLIVKTTKYLMKEIQNTKFAYCQSDKISILMHDCPKWYRGSTQPWFGNNIQKITSVAASMASSKFSLEANPLTYKNKYGTIIQEYVPVAFDARVFNLPKEEVINYFIWRQNDCSRNAVLRYGQHCFGHKKLQGLKVPQILDLFKEINIDYENEIHPKYRRGILMTPPDHFELPILTSEEGRQITKEILKPLIYGEKEF